MKKNSFKRFLAVTLAAATALTFAPVSTLGLSGVVQAQAASTTVTGITAPSTTSIKYGSSDTLDFTLTTSADETFTGTVTNDITASVQSVTSDGLAKAATTTDYTITTVADSKAIKTHTVKVAPTGTTSLPVGNYQLVVTITVNGASKTFTSPFTVSPKSYTKISAPTGDGDLDIDLNGSTDAETGEFSIIYPDGKAASPAALASADVPNAFGVTFTDKDGKDATSKFTVAAKGTSPSNNTTTATSSADGVATTYFVVKANGAAAGTYTMNVAGSKTASIVVYDSSNDVATASTTSNGTVAGAAFSDVTNSKATLALTNGKITSTESGQEKTWTIGTTVKFALAPIGTAATSISSYLSANKIAAYSTNSNASTIVTANNSSLSYGKLDKYGNLAFGSVAPAITVPSDTAEGTYQVELLVDVDGKYATANVSFTVSASNNNNNNNNNGEISNTSASTSDVFGGITTDILATDNTSYSLVESGAYFVLNGTRYTANQLHWYLTTAPNATPKNMGFTQGAATITESATGKLDITVNNATQFASDVNGKAHIVGIYESGSQNTIVYNHPLTVTPKANMVTKKYSAGTISKKLSEVNDAKFAEKFLDSTDFYGVNNKYLNGANSTIYPAQSVNEGRNFSVTFNDAAGATDKPAKDSVLKVKTGNTIPADGVYYEKYYVVYEDTSADAHNNGKFVAEITVNVSVNAGPQIKVKSGDFTFSSEDNDPNKNYDNIVVDLDLTTNKTFDLKPYLYSNMSGTTYDYAPDTQNVSVKDGVVTAVSVGTAAVKITPTADGVKGKEVYVFFRVNKNAKDTITVEGKDGDKADVLTTRQYASAVKNNKISDEEDLAKAQLGYIQIEVNGKETEDKKEALKATSKGAGTLTYSLPNTVKGVKIDSKTGEITIAHDRINPNGNGTGFTSFTFPVKVVSSGSASSALTTGYFYVVVDYPDANIEGLEKSYTVGTSLKATDGASWLDLSVNNKNSKVSANVPTGSYDVTPIYKSSELDDSKLYDDDDQNAFDWYNEYYLRRATVENKTEHVLVSASDSANRIGNTYRIAEIKSVPGKTNYVTKIVNVADGKTIYEADGATSGAAITINKKTVVKVSVAYAPDASLNAKDDPAFTIDGGDDDFNHNTTNVFVAATENPKTYEVTLVPSMEGTQVIYINPTQARLSKTDYSLVDTDYLAFAVKYDTKAASATPAKVTGLKVTNAKGAKVTVKFNKVTTYPTMRYYVQKKIGKKTGGKSVGSTKTTLSVKKGATIKVRVKAYYYDENGTKHVGKYSAWKTLKTDKK